MSKNQPSTSAPGRSGHDHPGLEVQVERTAPGVARVRLHVPAEELRKARSQQLTGLSQRVRMKGFRPGKAPRAMLEKQFGAEVEREVLEHFLSHALESAINQHSLRPATQPRIDLEKSKPAPGADWSAEFELLLRPELQLGKIEGLEVEARPVAVGEEELVETLAELGRAHSRPEPAGEAGLSESGMALAKLEFFREAGTEPIFARDGIRISSKSPPPGVDKGVFEAALHGARAGETREFDLVFPASFPVEDARGTRGRCRIGLSEVYRIVPPTDAELQQALGVESADALRETVRARILAHKQEAENRRIESELLERVMEAHPMELPEPLIEEQVDAHLAELFQALRGQGLAEEEASARLEEERPRTRQGAERGLKAMYLIEEIARARELKITEQDLAAELAAIAQRNGTDVQEVGRYYKEQGLLRQLGLELLERKVRDLLREGAAVRLASG